MPIELVRVAFNNVERRKVGDKEIFSLSKEQAFDSSIPYDLLKSMIEDDNKQGKLVKHRGNTLCLN